LRKLQAAATANLALRRLKGESIAEIAKDIVMVSEGMRKLRATRMNEDTLLLLIQNAISSGQHTKYKPVSLKTIKAVIDGIDALESKHLKSKGKK
jgi:hypothetical protein